MDNNQNKITLKKGLILKKIQNQSNLNQGLSYEGLCIIRDFDIPIFIYNLLPNEIADIEITYYSKKCCFAKVIKLWNKSSKRKELNNQLKELYESGSSPLLSLSYQDQLNFKQTIINNLFQRNLNYFNVKKIIKSNNQLNYRNKISLQIEYHENQIKFGFYKKHSHQLIAQSDLYLGNSTIKKFYKNILLDPNNQFDQELKKTIFNLKPKKIILRSPSNNNLNEEIEIILILKNHPNKNLIDNLEKINKKISIYKFSIFIENKNHWINLLHHNGIEYQINNFRFNVKNDSFYQINEEIMVLIYQQIFDWIESSNLNIVDAFSGVGTIGSYITNKANKVYSIEINQIATMLAKSNILKNKLKNLEVINDDANDWIVKNAKKIDLVIFDPPREGLKKQSIEALIQSKIKKIIYLSCDPKTLVRDLKELINNNYLIKEVIPYDMFPQTHHIETLVLLEKK